MVNRITTVFQFVISQYWWCGIPLTRPQLGIYRKFGCKVFSNRWHNFSYWNSSTPLKREPKNRTVAKSESDLLKKNEDKNTAPQSCKVLATDFTELYLHLLYSCITFKLGKLVILKYYFQKCGQIFVKWLSSKLEKNTGGSIDRAKAINIVFSSTFNTVFWHLMIPDVSVS